MPKQGFTPWNNSPVSTNLIASRTACFTPAAFCTGNIAMQSHLDRINTAIAAL
jgi:hypothetical protein